MRVLFVTHNFPPEVNALARRTYDHARQWVENGGEVEIVTAPPHFPEGAVYPGFRNRLSRETVDGIRVLRVPMLPRENRGAVRRLADYLSFMASAAWHGPRHAGIRPDIVVASSPQFFTALAGYRIARRFRVPFVLEIRDLWPESAVATGVIGRNPVVRLFERVERFLYRNAEHIVVVTESFREHITGLGNPARKITVLKNGVFLERFATRDAEAESELRTRYGLEGQFVVSYIGTVGAAHGAEVLLEAARLCADPDVTFMVVGAGARRAELEATQERLRLPNFRLVEKQPHERIPHFYHISSASVVHLRNLPLFRTVLPSKLFEAMAAERPILLGVEGESRRLVKEAGAGIAIPPEDPDALVEAVLRLKADPELRREMGARGRKYVQAHHDRRKLARRYWRVLEGVVGKANVVSGAE